MTRQYRARPGEPKRRSKTNQMHGRGAEAAFKRANPKAKRKGWTSDFSVNGKRIEVKHGTAAVRPKQKGRKVVRYIHKKHKKYVKISDKQARLIRNANARKQYHRKKKSKRF